MRKFYAYHVGEKIALSPVCGESDTMTFFDGVTIEDGDVKEAVRQMKSHGYTVDASEIVFEYPDGESDDGCSVCGGFSGSNPTKRGIRKQGLYRR